MRRRSSIRVSKGALLGMVAAAIETFPNECMGAVLSKSPGKAWFAVPYQIARRREGSVTSQSLSKILLVCSRGVAIAAEFHSHPYASAQVLDELEPSYQDIKEMRPGKVEFIVRIHRAQSKERWIICGSNGDVCMSLGRFRFLIRAFEKKKRPKSKVAFDSSPLAHYSRLRIKLSS